MSCHMSDSEFNGDSSELEVADGQKGQQDEMLSDYMGGQQDSIHLCDDSSATSSISGWTDRRDSLATTTSQTSSNDTSTACRSPAVSVSGGLNSTLKKQDLETLNEEFGESMRIPDCNAGDKSPLVSSTPCATSLVKIRSPRSSPLHAQIRKEEASSQAAVHEDSRSIVPQPTLTQHIASRSRMPTFGFTGIRRRPSETPAYGSLDGELSPSMVDRSPVSSNGSLNKKTFSPPYPSGSSSSSSFASLTVNKIRNVRSTPLLRRKGSSQLRLLSANSILEQGGDCKEAYVADLEGASKVRGDNPSLSTLKPPFMGVRKGSLPEVLKRYEGTASTVQRRASFLPTSLRRKS